MIDTNQCIPVTGNSFHHMVQSLYGSPYSSSCKHWVLRERLYEKYTVDLDDV